MKLAKSLFVLAGLLAFPVFAAVNINTATQSELEAIRGVGPAKAKAIISYRDANGAFKSVQELDKVKGFGKATIEKLQGELTVDTTGAKQ